MAKSSNKQEGLAGKLLIAMPGMEDKRFERAVIFMCAHDDKGAMGLMVNHKMPEIAFPAVIEQTGIKSDIAIDLKKVSVLNGGPVDGARGFLLHSGDFHQKDTIRVNKNYGVSGTIEALTEVVQGKGPQNMLFVLGHAGWEAGQLDQELNQNAWLVADARPEIVFELENDKKWALALLSIGVDPAMLSHTPGHA